MKDDAEPDSVADEMARQVIGAAIEVHRVLGLGFQESIYEQALAVEMRRRNIPFERQKAFGVMYRDEIVGEGRVDFLVAGSLIVELKAIEHLLPVHKAQIISYLKATGCRLGLLINFNESLLKAGIQRVVYSLS